MPDNDFNRALSAVESEDFESSMLDVAKQIVSKNPLCTDQIAQICRLFSFEKTKLDFAKYAYQYCVDKNNYYLINDVFEFSSSKNDLRKFVEKNE